PGPSLELNLRKTPDGCPRKFSPPPAGRGRGHDDGNTRLPEPGRHVAYGAVDEIAFSLRVLRIRDEPRQDGVELEDTNRFATCLEKLSGGPARPPPHPFHRARASTPAPHPHVS